MTTIFSAQKLSNKKSLSKISKRILGMESLESREMLSVNPLGIDQYSAPDFVQTNNLTTSQEFTTEAAPGDVGTVTATVTNPAAVSVTAAIETGATLKYTLYYTIQDNGIYAGTGTWKKFETKSVTDTGANSVSFTAFNATATIPAITAKQYVFFGVAQGEDETPTTITADQSSKVEIAAITALPSNGTATASGVTTDAVTITWTKPTTYIDGSTTKDIKTVKSYTLTYNDGENHTISATEIKTKTTWTLTGLKGNISNYTITAVVDEKVASGSGETNVPVLVATGSFPLVATGDAADVTVGPPTEVKAAYAKASGNKLASVKVTWKAPVNYAGGYVVTLHDVTDSVTDTTKTFNPGDKLEWTVSVGSGVVDKHRYSVTVTTTATNNIPSTPTYVNVGDVPAATPVAPLTPKAPTTAAISPTAIPGGTTVTLEVNAGESSAPNKTVGFYVGVTTSSTVPAKNTVTFADLVYVPLGSASTTVNLKVAATDYIYAFAVGADGTISDVGDIAVAAATITTDVAATSTNAGKDYPAANDVKSVAATADTSAKNKYKVTWTAATDYISGGDATTPSAATDFKYEVTGYRITATIKNGSTAGPSEVQYVAKGTNEAIFTNLRWDTKYDFKVEALVTYTSATGTSTFTWDTGNIVKYASAGSSKTGVAVAKAPAVADAITVAEKTGTGVNTGIDTTVTISNATVSTSYIVTVTDSNKAVLGTTTVTTGPAETSKDVALEALIGSNLTPKAKYTVTVQTVGSIPGTVSKGKTATITAADFVSATLKDTKGTTINSVKVKVELPSKGAGANDKYYIEYTNVVDAKGKPDWNAAAVYSDAGTPKAVTGTGTIEIKQLDPNSQYFFRVVTVDKEYNGTTVEWDNMEKVSTSKELKIKTAAVPLPTIAKNGFALDANSAFGLKLVGNSMARVDALAATNKQVLGALATGTGVKAPAYVYTLIVSQDSKTDKATGKLLGAETVKTIPTDPSTAVTLTEDTTNTDKLDKKVTNLSGEATFVDIFKTLGVDNNNFSGVKGLNVQVQVDVYYGDDSENKADNPDSIHFTLYSKASKIALPKWFV